jgi:putative flippase GtrA
MQKTAARPHVYDAPTLMINSDATQPEAPSAHRPETSILSRLISHVPPGQFLRYIVVGGWNTAFGYSTFAGIYYLLHGYVIPHVNIYWQAVTAQVFSIPINFTASYLCYKIFVFKTKGNYLREWLRSIAVYGVGFLPSLALLPLLVKALLFVPHIHGNAPYLANALLMGVGVIYSFLGHRNVTFKVSPDA